jgi:hypothetical protein
MNGFDIFPELPPDLRDLEAALAASVAAQPSGLRQRVLAAVTRELVEGERRQRRAANWRFAAAIALAALAGMNFVLGATSGSGERLWLQAAPAPGEVDAAAREIARLAPELTARESRRQALLLSVQVTPSMAPLRGRTQVLPGPPQTPAPTDW